MQGVAVAACDANHIALNRRLHFGLAVFNKLDDLFGLLLRDALLELNVLADGPARRRLDLAVAQGL